MRSQKEIEQMIASFIEKEKAISFNPFLTTRIMALIDRRTKEPKRSFAVWQNVAMALSIVAAVALGIRAGGMYKQTNIHHHQTSAMFINDDKMEHFMFYLQTQNE